MQRTTGGEGSSGTGPGVNSGVATAVVLETGASDDVAVGCGYMEGAVVSTTRS
jgi:hypothetical protein